MTKRADEALLFDMLAHAEEALSFCRGLDMASFTANRQVRWAVVKLIQVVGEASVQASDAARMAHPTIPWKLLRAMLSECSHNKCPIPPRKGRISKRDASPPPQRPRCPSGSCLSHGFDAIMPEHDHGMVTTAAVRKMADGEYDVMGVKLRMAGLWQFYINATAQGQPLKFSIPFKL